MNPSFSQTNLQYLKKCNEQRRDENRAPSWKFHWVLNTALMNVSSRPSVIFFIFERIAKRHRETWTKIFFILKTGNKWCIYKMYRQTFWQNEDNLWNVLSIYNRVKTCNWIYTFPCLIVGASISWGGLGKLF